MKPSTGTTGIVLITLILTLILLAAPDVQAGPRNKQVRSQTTSQVKGGRRGAVRIRRWFSLRRAPRTNKASTLTRARSGSKLGGTIKAKLSRTRGKLKSKLNRTRGKLKEWWRWQTKKDWKLMEVHPTDYVGMNASSLNPYFWNVWKDMRTGKTRITTDY